MAIQVLIPAPMRGLTNQQARVEVDQAGTVVEALSSLADQYPSIGERIFDRPGRIRRFVNVYLNGDDIRSLEGEETPVKDGDEIGIIPAMAGGQAA